MKADGATEVEIKKTTLANAKKDADIAYEEALKAEKQYNENIGKVNEEGVKALTKNLIDKQQKNKDANAAYLELGYNTQAELNKAEDAAAKEAQQKRDAAAKDRQQKEKQAAMERIDAIITLEKNKEDTSEQLLRTALEKQFQLQNEGKKISTEVAKQQKEEINRIVTEELQKDKDARKEANDKKIAEAKEANAIILENLDVTLAESKLLYGEESAQVRRVTQETFDARKKAIDDEVALLQAKKMSVDGLTSEEILRLQSLATEQRKLTVEVQTEAQRQVQADRDKAQTLYDNKMAAAASDFELQQEILDAKVEQDRLFFESQLANENLTAEQRKAIEDAQTANKAANAEAQISIEEKKFQAQQAFLNATGAAIGALADLLGKNTVAGKALAVAASLINTYAAIAGQLKAFSGVPIPGYAIVQAIATGLIGFKAVKDIISVQVPTGGGGSTASAAAPANNGPSVGRPKGLATGGMVFGPGTGMSDSIPAMLSNGESVINAASTSMFRPLLSTINQLGGGAKFASGGVAESATNPLAGMDLSAFMSQTPQKTYVVAQDIMNQGMFDRLQKSRSEL